MTRRPAKSEWRRPLHGGLVLLMALVTGCGPTPAATPTAVTGEASPGAMDPVASGQLDRYSVQQIAPGRAQLRRQCRTLCRRLRSQLPIRRCVRLCERQLRPCAPCLGGTRQIPTLADEGPIDSGQDAAADSTNGETEDEGGGSVNE